MSRVHIYGGGTFSYIRNHLALCAPAFGTSAKYLQQQIPFSTAHLTKMAHHSSKLVTNDDVHIHLMELLKDPFVKCIVMNSALCDYSGKIDDVISGKHAQRLQSRETLPDVVLTPSPKVISIIKNIRPDILVVGFKTITGDDINTAKSKAARMDVDIVLINDTLTRSNHIWKDGEIIYGEYGGDRDEALSTLAGLINNEMVNCLNNHPVLDKVVGEIFSTFKVRVSPKSGGYINKSDALLKGIDILKESGYHYKHYIKSGWDQYEQGVYTISCTNDDFMKNLNESRQ